MQTTQNERFRNLLQSFENELELFNKKKSRNGLDL